MLVVFLYWLLNVGHLGEKKRFSVCFGWQTRKSEHFFWVTPRCAVVKRCLVSRPSFCVHLPRIFGSLKCEYCKVQVREASSVGICIHTFDIYKSRFTSAGLHPCWLDVALLCCPIRTPEDPAVSQQCASSTAPMFLCCPSTWASPVKYRNHARKKPHSQLTHTPFFWEGKSGYLSTDTAKLIPTESTSTGLPLLLVLKLVKQFAHFVWMITVLG